MLEPRHSLAPSSPAPDSNEPSPAPSTPRTPSGNHSIRRKLVVSGIEFEPTSQAPELATILPAEDDEPYAVGTPESGSVTAEPAWQEDCSSSLHSESEGVQSSLGLYHACPKQDDTGSSPQSESDDVEPSLRRSRSFARAEASSAEAFAKPWWHESPLETPADEGSPSEREFGTVADQSIDPQSAWADAPAVHCSSDLDQATHNLFHSETPDVLRDLPPIDIGSGGRRSLTDSRRAMGYKDISVVAPVVEQPEDQRIDSRGGREEEDSLAPMRQEVSSVLLRIGTKIGRGYNSLMSAGLAEPRREGRGAGVEVEPRTALMEWILRGDAEGAEGADAGEEVTFHIEVRYSFPSHRAATFRTLTRRSPLRSLARRGAPSLRSGSTSTLP